MPTLNYDGTPLAVNDAGFLVDWEAWDDDIARFLARDQEGVAELGPEHWRLLRFLRAFYVEHRRAPMVRILCKQSRLTLKRVYELFPSGPALGACKVAGLPSPDGCV